MFKMSFIIWNWFAKFLMFSANICYLNWFSIFFNMQTLSMLFYGKIYLLFRPGKLSFYGDLQLNGDKEIVEGIGKNWTKTR